MAQSVKQKAAFQAMLAGKKGKSVKQADPTKPFPAPPKAKGTAPAPKGKKPMAKVDMMLMKAMPGIGMPKKGKKGGKKC